MVDDNNGAYQFPVYGDPRGDSWKPDKPRLVVMSMPPTRPGAYTSQLELSGDVKEAERYVPLVTQQMMQMHQQNVNNLEIVTRPVDLGGGSSILCRRKFTEDVATIHVPPKPKALGPLHLNFDSSTVEEYQTGYAYDKFNGLPLFYPEENGYNSGITADTSLEYGAFGPSGKMSYGIKAASATSENWNGTADRWAYGNLYHSAKWDGPKTIGLVYNAFGSAGEVTIAKDLYWKQGYFYMSLDCWLENGSTVSGSSLRLGQLLSDIAPGSSGIVLARVNPISAEYSDTDYGVVLLSFRYSVDLFVNGEIAIDSGEISGTSGLGDSSVVLSQLSATARQEYNTATSSWLGTETGLGCCQFFAYNTLATNDDIQKTTDKLAGKWGL